MVVFPCLRFSFRTDTTALPEILTRDKHTRAYVQRRRAEGKTTREIRRCLKRYVARQLYRQLTNTPALRHSTQHRHTAPSDLIHDLVGTPG